MIVHKLKQTRNNYTVCLYVCLTNNYRLRYYSNVFISIVFSLQTHAFVTVDNSKLRPTSLTLSYLFNY